MRNLLTPIVLGSLTVGISFYLSMPDVEVAMLRLTHGQCQATATGPNIAGLHWPCIRQALSPSAETKPIIVRAEVTRAPYPAMMSMAEECQQSDRPDHCTVRLGTLETGWRIVHSGGGCVREETKLVKWVDFKKDGYQLHLPHTVTNSRQVECSEA